MLSPGERQTVVLTALEKFERPLQKYATRLLDGDQDAARDAVQHAFLKLCERSDLAKTTDVAAWLYTVCRNRAMDYWRASKRVSNVEDNRCGELTDREMEPTAQLERTDLLRLIQSLISRLPDSEKEVAELWSQGFSNREIAEVTDKPDGSVRVCLHRALKSIRNHAAIKQWFSEDGLVQQIR